MLRTSVKSTYCGLPRNLVRNCDVSPQHLPVKFPSQVLSHAVTYWPFPRPQMDCRVFRQLRFVRPWTAVIQGVDSSSTFRRVDGS